MSVNLLLFDDPVVVKRSTFKSPSKKYSKFSASNEPIILAKLPAQHNSVCLTLNESPETVFENRMRKH